MIRRIIVFCGSSLGTDPVYRSTAEELGQAMVRRRIGLVYGGGDIGLMGVIADTVTGLNGEVIGVIPGFLQDREVAHHGLTQLIVTASMHERKQRMHELGDAVIAMPGGFGTLDEFFELLTWKQLGLHRQPIGLLNVNGFFDPLLAQMDRMVKDGFLKAAYRDGVVVRSAPEALLDALV
jgi:uncharacterized protein (TIGR00730 family)